MPFITSKRCASNGLGSSATVWRSGQSPAESSDVTSLRPCSTITGLRELIESVHAHLRHINSTEPTGTVIWIGLARDDLVRHPMRDNVKLKNIRRDPRVALSFDAPREPGVWITP